MALPASDFWYVVQESNGDIAFLTDLDWIAQGGRWGTLGEAEMFTEKDLAIAVASRIPGAKVTRFD